MGLEIFREGTNIVQTNFNMGIVPKMQTMANFQAKGKEENKNNK